MIDAGENLETAVIASVGTAGATTVGAATRMGATVIPVASAIGFSDGQTITIDDGANSETAVVASIRRFGGTHQSSSPRRSLIRTQPVHRCPAPASPSPLR